MSLASLHRLVATICALVALPLLSSFATSTEDRSVFYRLLAKYQHGDEIVDFDIVVGCAVRVTRWGDGDKSYDSFRDPVAYVKATKDGGAILQMVPGACGGETTENGEVPDDFLPGAVWFDDADDLSLGIAYVTEDAYDSPLSELKFLGASIWPATRANYIAFEPIAAQNLIDPRPLFAFQPLPNPSELRPHFGDSAALAKLRRELGCHAILRYRLSDPEQRAYLRKFWPPSKPKFWMPSKPQLEQLNDDLGLSNDVLIDGRPISNYFRLNHHTGKGFPTRAQGGVFRSKHLPSDKLPPTVFPVRRDEGIPWVTEDFPTATALHRDVDQGDGAYQGFAYCYGSISGQDFQVPAYIKSDFSTRVDGEPIFGEATDGRPAHNRPWPFFERDEYFYFLDTFGLN